METRGIAIAGLNDIMSVWPHGDTSLMETRGIAIAGLNVQMRIDVRLTEYRLQIIASDIKVDNR